MPTGYTAKPSSMPWHWTAVSDIRGHCLCGAVTLTTSREHTLVAACHCGMCRRWGGGPMMVVPCGDDVRFEGEDNIRVFDSSDYAQRGFCSQCGSHLFYRVKQTNEYNIPVGLFDEQDHFRFDTQLCIDRKPDWYRFANDTDEITEAEELAQRTQQDTE